MVGSWLNFQYGDDFRFWVGARDLLGDDVVKWTDSGSLVHSSFWLSGSEPTHLLGDCAYIGTQSPFYLELYECDDNTLNGNGIYPLCELLN